MSNQFTDEEILYTISLILDILDSLYGEMMKSFKCSIILGNVDIRRLSRIIYHTEYDNMIFIRGLSIDKKDINFFIDKKFFEFKNYNDLKNYIKTIKLEWYI